jgi:hypothetical protein
MVRLHSADSPLTGSSSASASRNWLTMPFSAGWASLNGRADQVSRTRPHLLNVSRVNAKRS